MLWFYLSNFGIKQDPWASSFLLLWQENAEKKIPPSALPYYSPHLPCRFVTDIKFYLQKLSLKESLCLMGYIDDQGRNLIVNHKGFRWDQPVAPVHLPSSVAHKLIERSTYLTFFKKEKEKAKMQKFPHLELGFYSK